MKDREGRRSCDNGWRKAIRDYGVAGVFLLGVFYAGVEYNDRTAAATERIDNKHAIQELVKIQIQRAREMGQVTEALKNLKTMLEQRRDK